MFKIDKYPFGILLGLFTPILGLTILYFLKAYPNDMGPSAFIDNFFVQKSNLTAMGSLCLVANIILFTIFLNNMRDKTAIGIFIMTVMYGLIILYAKFFM
jgi:hypothetical protein